jgi:hypothetical protein
MSLYQYDTVMICEYYICAIEYDDYSGLSDDEEKAIGKWIESLPQSVTFEHGESSEVTTCAISGLKAQCLSVKIWSPDARHAL